ncbi:MAG: AMP-binding protein, partial [Thiovulaceae bacterium]|nr:AMP-binding protein [Sulfurimonadaceae bacterium]
MGKPLIQLPELTLKALFDYSRANYDDRPALSLVDGEVVSYAQFAKKVAEVQLLLSSHGIRRGDKVALYSENMPNWGVIYFAVTTMGAVVVPILPDFHPSEALHIATHAECRAAFISQKLMAALLDESNPPALTLVVYTNNLEILADFSSPDKVTLTLQKGQKQLQSAMEKLGREIEMNPIKEDDLAAIIYTSGTTGNSKGVMLTHKNLTFEAVAAQHIVEIYPEDRFLSVLPLAHSYECTIGLLIPLLNGASVFYILKRPTPTVLLKALSAVKPTFMLSVPLIIEKIYKNKIQPNFQKNLLIRTLYAIPWVRKMFNRIAGKKLMETFGGELRFFGIGGAALSPLVEKFLREAEFPY